MTGTPLPSGLVAGGTRARLSAGAKATAGATWATLGRPRDDRRELTVFLSHGTPTPSEAHFSAVLATLRRSFVILGPEETDRYFSESTSFADGPYASLTFDDGLASNISVARFLASEGVSATFFVVPGFVEAPDPRRYFVRQLLESDPAMHPDLGTEQWNPLSVEQLLEMKSLGHRIGSHTMTHSLRSGMPVAERDHEIRGSRQWIAENIGEAPEAFASPRDTQRIDREIAERIRATYQRHYITMDGSNAQRSRGIAYRTHLEWFWPRDRAYYAIGCRALERWRWRVRSGAFVREVML